MGSRGRPAKASVWTEGRCAHLTRLYYMHRSDEAIAECFGAGMTARAVANQRSKMGLVCRKLKRRGSLDDFTSRELLTELQKRGVYPSLPTATDSTVERPSQTEHSGGLSGVMLL